MKPKINKLEKKRLAKIHEDMRFMDLENRKHIKIAPEDCCISLQYINKIYSNDIQAVFDFNLDIKEKEFIVLVGPSGCGKSTTLRMIAGLEAITYGDLFISGKYANDLLPKERDISMVFQSYALYPNMSVYENLAFSLKVRHLSKSEIDERVNNAAKILEIEELLDRKPLALSGGQRQRVALGRAIVRNAKVFLMDEPLSNLDAKLRVQMRGEIVSLHRRIGATTVYVTHDQTEAMTMADRIVIMKGGYIQQIDTPKEIYNNPKNLFVATFIGSPAMNILDATLSDSNILFANGYKHPLTKKQIEIISSFYEEKVNKLKATIEEIEKDIEQKKYILARPKLKKALDKLEKNRTLKINELIIIRNSLKAETKEENKLAEIARVSGEIDALTREREQLMNGSFVPIASKKIEKIYNADSLLQIAIATLESKKEELQKYIDVLGTKEKKFLFGVRPEDFILAKSEQKDSIKISVNIPELLGNEYHLLFKFGEQNCTAKINSREEVISGQEYYATIDNKRYHIFDPLSEETIL